MKKIYFFGALFLISGASMAQSSNSYRKASMDETGRMHVTEFATSDKNGPAGNRDFSSLPGFPMAFYANQYFKNTRGVVVADVNNDGWKIF